MNKTELLITGQSSKSFQTFKDLFNKYGDWKIIRASNDEEAIEKFHRHNFEVVVFTNTVSSDEERKLRKIFTFQNPDIIIAMYQHGNEVLLVDEIVTALDTLRNAKTPYYSLVDDAFKNAGLNIIIQ